MIVSLSQRLVSAAVARIEGPLQSRADHNTRKPESGGRPERNEARGRADKGAEGRMQETRSVQTIRAVSRNGAARQTHQEIWQQLGPNCLKAVWQRAGAGSIPRPLPRGETL